MTLKHAAAEPVHRLAIAAISLEEQECQWSDHKLHLQRKNYKTFTVAARVQLLTVTTIKLLSPVG